MQSGGLEGADQLGRGRIPDHQFRVPMNFADERRCGRNQYQKPDLARLDYDADSMAAGVAPVVLRPVKSTSSSHRTPGVILLACQRRTASPGGCPGNPTGRPSPLPCGVPPTRSPSVPHGPDTQGPRPTLLLPDHVRVSVLAHRSASTIAWNPACVRFPILKGNSLDLPWGSALLIIAHFPGSLGEGAKGGLPERRMESRSLYRCTEERCSPETCFSFRSNEGPPDAG